MRTDDVWLDDSEPRCIATSCPHMGSCARAKAPIPKKYAKVADFSLDLTIWANCGEWVSAVHARRPEPEAPTRPIHPHP